MLKKMTQNLPLKVSEKYCVLLEILASPRISYLVAICFERFDCFFERKYPPGLPI